MLFLSVYRRSVIGDAARARDTSSTASRSKVKNYDYLSRAILLRLHKGDICLCIANKDRLYPLVVGNALRMFVLDKAKT